VTADVTMPREGADSTGPVQLGLCVWTWHEQRELGAACGWTINTKQHDSCSPPSNLQQGPGACAYPLFTSSPHKPLPLHQLLRACFISSASTATALTWAWRQTLGSSRSMACACRRAVCARAGWARDWAGFSCIFLCCVVARNSPWPEASAVLPWQVLRVCVWKNHYWSTAPLDDAIP
jgi:hypothetical protein